MGFVQGGVLQETSISTSEIVWVAAQIVIWALARGDEAVGADYDKLRGNREKQLLGWSRDEETPGREEEIETTLGDEPPDKIRKYIRQSNDETKPRTTAAGDIW